VTYVWFDALSNYLTVPAAQGDPGVPDSLHVAHSTQQGSVSLWPADIHVIGKDIVKFHSVYWPIMLKAMEAPLPKQVLVHGFWQKDAQRMSKSTGNVVDPIAVIDEWGVDAFRFYVVRELDIGPDGNWTEAGFEARYSAELANGLGNLVNRSLSMLKRYRQGIVPAVSNELAPEAEKLIAETRSLLEQNQLQAALQAIWSLVTRANQYVDHTAPFKLAKDPANAQRLDEVLYNLVEVCRILAVLLWPFLPGTAEKIYAQLGVAGAPEKFSAAKWGCLAPGHAIGDPSPLFPRKEA
jgi:methionyl-tRNA synthetase